MLYGSIGLVLALVTEVPRAPPGSPPCAESPAREKTCQLRVDWATVGLTWAGIAGALWLNVNQGEGRTAKWNTAGNWEHALRDRLRGATDDERGAATGRSDRLLYTGMPLAILAAEIWLSVPEMSTWADLIDPVQDLYVAGTAMMIGSQVNQLLKWTTARARPRYAPIVGEAATAGWVHSFPSGHVISAAALTSSFSTVLHQRGYAEWWVAAAAGIVTTIVVGLERIISDAHWGSDVIGGAALGAASGWAFAFFEHGRMEPGQGPAIVVASSAASLIIRW